MVSPVTTGPAPSNGIIGVLRAAYGKGWQQSSLGVLPILYGIELSKESVVGGTSFTGTATLQSAAPPGGITVRLVSSDTSLVRPPATVFIPGGATDADFTIATSAVSVPTRVTIDPGTESDSGVHQFQVSVVVTPPGSPTPPPSLSSLTLSQSAISCRRHGNRNGKTNFPRSCWWRSRFLAGQHGRSGDHSAQRDRPRR